MYKKAKGIAVNSNVTSSMIWGSQWDATLKWMYNSGNAEKKKYTYDSTGKGNYYDTNGNKTIATGSIETYAVNNIYDMAGNVWDWTIEANSTPFELIVVVTITTMAAAIQRLIATTTIRRTAAAAMVSLCSFIYVTLSPCM